MASATRRTERPVAIVAGPDIHAVTDDVYLAGAHRGSTP